MRLGTCIALELAVAAGAVGGVWLGVGEIARLTRDHLGTSVALAATAELAPGPARPALEVLPAASLAEPVAPPEPARPRTRSIYGVDDELLAPLGASRVARVRLNHGGTSLSLRLDFEAGGRAAFKPEQTHPQSDPRREIAAYRLDRWLGLGRVPPAKPIAIPLAELLDAAEPRHRRIIAARLADEGVVRAGVLHGEVSWWIPDIKFAELGRDRIDEREGRERWVAYVKAGAAIPPEHRGLVAQISACVVFDALIDNADRWSGANTRMSPDGRELYFMDNTMSFSMFKFGHEMPTLALRRTEVFSRALIGRLRELTAEVVGELAAADEATRLGPLLGPGQIRAVLARRDQILKHVDRLIAEHGEDVVLAFP